MYDIKTLGYWIVVYITTANSLNNQEPKIMELSWILNYNEMEINRCTYVIKSDNFTIANNLNNSRTYITEEYINKYGKQLNTVLDIFTWDLLKAKYIVGYNIEYIIQILGNELHKTRKGVAIAKLCDINRRCILRENAPLNKEINLMDLYELLLGEERMVKNDEQRGVYLVKIVKNCFIQTCDNVKKKKYCYVANIMIEREKEKEIEKRRKEKRKKEERKKEKYGKNKTQTIIKT